MWLTLPAKTPLYRVTREHESWDDVLRGLGAVYNEGGRYNVTFQHTVYASEDPIVALTEFGWHLSLAKFVDIGLSNPFTYPLVETAKLWRFRLDSDTQLIDICSAQAAQYFGYPAQLPYNCDPNHHPRKDGKRLRSASQQLADDVRTFTHPPKPFHRPEGLQAPSVRTPPLPKYLPRQVVLFVIPAHGSSPKTIQDRAEKLDDWRIEYEFLAAGGRAASSSDPLVAWMAPRFKLTGNTNPLPKYLGRPRGKQYPAHKWHTLDIRYSPY